MTVPIIYRVDNAPRGVVGKGSNLSAADIDGNFYNLAVAVTALQTSLKTNVSIDHFIVSGTLFWVVMTDHSERGPYTLPTVSWNFRGVWTASTIYAVNDVFTNGPSVYVVMLAHTSATTFDPGANDTLGHNYYGLLLTIDGGMPSSGVVKGVLTKNSNLDFDASWQLPTLSGLIDVAFLSSPGLEDGDSLLFNGLHWTNGRPSLSNLADVSFPASPGLAIGSTMTWAGEHWTYDYPTLQGLHDIGIEGTPRDDDVLIYNGGWTNGAPLLDGTFVNLAPNPPVDYSVLFYRTSQGAWTGAKLNFNLVEPNVSVTPNPGDVVYFNAVNTPHAWTNGPQSRLYKYVGGSVTLDPEFLGQDVGATSSVTITLPTDSSGGFGPFPHFRALALSGDVTVTIAPASGVTLTVPGGYLPQTRRVGSPIGVSKSGETNTWYVYGELAFDPAQAALGNTGTITVDLLGTALEFYTATPTNNFTYNMINPQAGRRATFIVTTSGTTSYTITFGSNFKSTGTLVTGSVTGKTFSVDFICDGTNLVEIARTTAM